MLDLSHINLCELIPHAGDMCLIASIDSYDANGIVCRATSHCLKSNPLRSQGILPAIAGVEFAAQAMAIHGSLLLQSSDTPPPKGFLAAMRGVNVYVDRLDNIVENIVITAERYSQISDAFSYTFKMTAIGEPLLDGRLSVKVLLGEYVE